jgi:hypothetical protein
LEKKFAEKNNFLEEAFTKKRIETFAKEFALLLPHQASVIDI